VGKKGKELTACRKERVPERKEEGLFNKRKCHVKERKGRTAPGDKGKAYNRR